MPPFYLNSDNVLARIRNNDPAIKVMNIKFADFAYLEIFDDLGVVGSCIGKNTSINSIRIFDVSDGFNEFDTTKLDTFFDAVAKSQSINDIYFERCKLSGEILKLFGISNFEKVEIRQCYISQQTAQAIRRASRLSQFTIQRPQFDDEPETPREFFTSLNHHHRLESLELQSPYIEENGYVALGKIISDPHSNLRKLTLFDCEEELFMSLKNGLAHNTSLQILHLRYNDIHKRGWQAVSAALSSPVSTLRRLKLFMNSIDDECAEILAKGINNSNTLEELEMRNVCDDDLSSDGWLAVVTALQKPNLPLKLIDLSHNSAVDNRIASCLAQVLQVKSNTIETFDVSYCINVAADGRRVLASALFHPMPALKTLAVGNNDFDGDSAVTIINGLFNKPSLRCLELAGHTVQINDDGWKKVSRLLCDNLCLESIRNSNHCLNQFIIHDQSTIPANVVELLHMNESGEASEAVRLKIIHHYKGINIESLVGAMPEFPELQGKLVPSVAACLGCKHGWTSLYRFIRNEASLFERVGSMKTNSVKLI